MARCEAPAASIPDCPDCPGHELDLSQPDEGLPERLMGHCQRCKVDYFVGPVYLYRTGSTWPEGAEYKIKGPAGLAVAG